MGATVLLFNRFDRLVKRAITNERGAFGFDSLPTDTYSLRVTMASFMPALRQNLAIQSGVRSILSINLATALSSIELVYAAPGQGAIMNDDWKWVLRSSMATRPVLRYLPYPASQEKAQAWFSQTRGLVKVSAGDGGSALGEEADLGTAFAVATSFLGSNQLQFSGNFGYGSRGGLPSAGFRTKYSRNFNDGLVATNPEVQLTMRQIYLPARGGGMQQRDSLPALRTISARVSDRTELADGVNLEYGVAIESVQFFDRLNYLSPYARLSYSLGDSGTILLGYSSGLPPPDALSNAEESDLNQDVNSLAVFPRISRRAGHAHAQRAENYELAYRREFGGFLATAGVYKERITNGALIASGAVDGIASGDVLPDLFSSSSVFNIGSYSTAGYVASVSRDFGKSLSVTGAYGHGGVLAADTREIAAAADPSELRDRIRSSHRHWAAARVAGTVPGTRTRIGGSYLFTDYSALTPSRRYLTQRYTPDAGLNIQVRQPIPTLGLLSGRLEAHAELRNLLAQGYLPLNFAGGRSILLMQNARAVRGGLSFIF